nr:hypothetical protein [Tanacetum cinerariifolium]
MLYFPCFDPKGLCKYEKGWERFLRVETSLFEGMLAARQPEEEKEAEAQVQADNAVATDVEENVAEDVPHDAIPSPL